MRNSVKCIIDKLGNKYILAKRGEYIVSWELEEVLSILNDVPLRARMALKPQDSFGEFDNFFS